MVGSLNVILAEEQLALYGRQTVPNKIKMTECTKHSNVDVELCPICLMEEVNTLRDELKLAFSNELHWMNKYYKLLKKWIGDE